MTAWIFVFFSKSIISFGKKYIRFIVQYRFLCFFGIVSKNITITEFFNWSWQRISNDVRYAINKNGGLAMGILPQTIRKEFNQKDEEKDMSADHHI